MAINMFRSFTSLEYLLASARARILRSPRLLADHELSVGDWLGGARLKRAQRPPP